MKPSNKKILEFGQMLSGTHFTDGARKFIKLQNPIPSGLNRKYIHTTDGFTDSFNAVDYQGCPAKCPDWCKFEIVEDLDKNESE